MEQFDAGRSWIRDGNVRVRKYQERKEKKIPKTGLAEAAGEALEGKIQLVSAIESETAKCTPAPTRAAAAAAAEREGRRRVGRQSFCLYFLTSLYLLLCLCVAGLNEAVFHMLTL